MRYRTLLLSIVLLSCFTALLYALSTTAFAGQGCGTNWMGDTSGDTDFYVSKNQNQGTSSSTAASQPAKEAVALGSTASKAGQSVEIQSLTASPGGPQPPGTAITWTATAAASEQLLYDFLLKGPATDGQLKDQTGWTAVNTWTWNTTEADAGENQVEVRTKRATSPDFDDSRAENYVIASATATAEQKSTSVAEATAPASVAADSHPVSRTGNSMKSKPRLAPDERPRVVPTNPSGPNMSMPDPSPKPPAGTEKAAADVPVETPPEPEEAKVMDVQGKWSVTLEGGAGSLDLILVQADENLMGSGTLNDQGGKIPVTAKGSISGNSLSLDVGTVVGEYVNQIDKRFSLELVKVDRMVSGAYEAYAGDDLTGKGNATANRVGA